MGKYKTEKEVTVFDSLFLFLLHKIHYGTLIRLRKKAMYPSL